MLGITDKVVVITGASSGIGEATALLHAQRGAKVVLGARRLDRLEALAARIADGSGEAAFASIVGSSRQQYRHYADLSPRRPWPRIPAESSPLDSPDVVICPVLAGTLLGLRDEGTPLGIVTARIKKVTASIKMR